MLKPISRTFGQVGSAPRAAAWLLLVLPLYLETWFGIFGPADKPITLAQHITGASDAVMGDADLRARLLALGIDPRTGDRRALAEAARVERERWTGLVRRLGIRLGE